MFTLSKIVEALLNPFNLFIIGAGLGWLLIRVRPRHPLGRRLLAAVVVAGFGLAVIPVDRWAMAVLEDRFAPPSVLPERVDGIIVLGGGINPRISALRGQVTVNGAVARLTALVPLARAYPEARLIFTGGSGALLSQEYKEATYAVEFYRQIGFDPSRIIFESQSRNTFENAKFSKDVMAPKPGETWVLITSAIHMPRAVGSFRAQGWPVVAYPVDYHTAGAAGLGDLRFNAAAGLGGLGAVLHEVLGLIGYRLMGWSDSLFPGP